MVKFYRTVDIMDKTESYEFIFFLNWLVDEKNWNAKEIIGVVEKPYVYKKHWAEYLNQNKGEE